LLTIKASPEAKHVYGAGAEVPFLGAGYVVELGSAMSEPIENLSRATGREAVPQPGR
jgi:hypothetical protein